MTSAQVLSHFREIMTIPRESGHEEHIIAYLQKSARRTAGSSTISPRIPSRQWWRTDG